MPIITWTNIKEGKIYNHLLSVIACYQVVTEGLEGVPARRGLVCKVCQGVGVWLGVVEVVHAGQVPPAGVTPDLDQASPQHDPEYQPTVAKYTDLKTKSISGRHAPIILTLTHLGRWQSWWHLPPWPEGNTPDSEEASFQQLALPAKGEPGLSHTDLEYPSINKPESRFPIRISPSPQKSNSNSESIWDVVWQPNVIFHFILCHMWHLWVFESLKIW